jgi:phage-related protein
MFDIICSYLSIAKEYIIAVLNWMADITYNLRYWITKLIVDIYRWICNLFRWLYDVLIDILLRIIKRILNVITNIINTLYDIISNIFINLTQTLLNFGISISNTFALVHDFGSGIYNYLRDKYDIIVDYAHNSKTSINNILISNPEIIFGLILIASIIGLLLLMIYTEESEQRSQSQSQSLFQSESDIITVEHIKI